MIAGKASLRDLQEHHDIVDLADFHDALDIEMELNEQNQPPPKG